MSWLTRCLPFDRAPDGAKINTAPCSGGFCHACEGCDLHCNCADTDEPRHIAGMNLGELP